MPRESNLEIKSRTAKIITVLRQTYPTAHCELNFSNPLQLLIATILSAQCTDKRVNIVTAELFKTYRTAQDFARAPLADLENAVKTTGFFRNKAKNIEGTRRDPHRPRRSSPFKRTASVKRSKHATPTTAKIN